MWYNGTIEDQGLPVVVQRMRVGTAREMGTSVQHMGLRSSHSPFLSQSDEVVGNLLEATRAFAGKNIGGVEADGSSKEGFTPSINIWQPSYWLKYELPWMVGHFFGRCILIFYVAKKL